MTYKQFAYLYDHLMQDVPYELWAEMTMKLKEKYGIKGTKLLDLACGTGEMSIRLAGAGLDVTGVDLSDDMLAVARMKADEQRFSIQFFQQDMADLDVPGLFDIVSIYCDSVNYLRTGDDVEKTFTGVFRHLNEGGLFLFDVHSQYKIKKIFLDHTFAVNQDDISYIWHCFPGQYPDSVEHELTFFVHDEETGQYDRIDEDHFQRTFPVSFYHSLLEKSGFTVKEVTADFNETEPAPESERIFFVAIKP
ncbi:class I SAM-dependent DNA methyltransferase [Bacillus sp. T33-2]|uniref:class I SAM-dependent DNA methyltransferase n=1 Tax=Bacillus sp. T33-2 TaxID=2054168 RepID=UPI000C765238|nr:class I SAM-dependent methyltransferase [Bacillus sp. T33-2]PLR93795.1 SAM-dependent methyltransferase [Bacillus sp. T33-2]